MDKDLEKTIEELELAGTPDERGVVSALMRESEPMDAAKGDAVREALLARTAKPRITGYDMKWNRLMYILPVGALAAIVLFIATQGRPGVGTPAGEPSRQVAVAAKLGFGDLPALAPGSAAATGETYATAASPERTASAIAPIAGGGTAAAEKGAVGAAAPVALVSPQATADLAAVGTANASAPAAIGMGGAGVTGSASAGVAIAPAPSPMPCVGCGVEPPPRVVYSFTGELPAIPSEIAVYRTRKPDYPSDSLAAILAPLGLRGFTGLDLQSFSFTDGDGMTWNYDASSGYLYFNSGSSRIVPLRADATAGRTGTIADDDALRATSAFLSAHGISTDGYGKPQVTRQDYGYPCKGGMPCPMMEAPAAAGGVTADTVASSAPAPDAQAVPAIYPMPYGGGSVTVTYGAMRDGYPILNWDGSDSPGISLSLDAATGKVTNGNVMLPVPADSSLYPARSAEDILAGMKQGGLSPYYYYGDAGGGLYTPEEESRRKTVDVTFGSARIGYVERYSDDGGSRYLLPVVGFRGSLKDQYGNVSDWGTIVPIVASGGSAGGASAPGAGTVTSPGVPTPTAVPGSPGMMR